MHLIKHIQLCKKPVRYLHKFAVVSLLSFLPFFWFSAANLLFMLSNAFSHGKNSHYNFYFTLNFHCIECLKLTFISSYIVSENNLSLLCMQELNA